MAPKKQTKKKVESDSDNDTHVEVKKPVDSDTELPETKKSVNKKKCDSDCDSELTVETKKPAYKQNDWKKSKDHTEQSAPPNTPEPTKEWVNYSDDDLAPASNQNSGDKRVFKKDTAGNFKENNRQKEHQNQLQNQRPRHQISSSINFNYNSYRNLNGNINEIPTTEVLKVLIVRAFDQNQVQLANTLKQTLRAMNLECNFPSTQPPQREFNEGNNNIQTNTLNRQQPLNKFKVKRSDNGRHDSNSRHDNSRHVNSRPKQNEN
jgi:hypothetical protein